MSDDNGLIKDNWAVVLGASSGFGESISLALADGGAHIFGVHLDRKSTMPNVERIQREISEKGRESVFFNINAAQPEKRSETIARIEETVKNSNSPGGVKVLVHSIAFGTLRPYIAPAPKDMVTEANLNMTLDVMAHSLVYWAQELISKNLMVGPARIFAMTSAGGHRVWPAYGPVSAAKAAIESHIRQLAMELSPRGITANSIRAGVTITPALEKIPGSASIIEKAREANPSGRLTTPKDVADAIVALCSTGAHWITGNVIGVDGGEDLI
ncbi:MAG: SDR family oxidoreductase [Thermodesulfobacteriota bacterium]